MISTDCDLEDLMATAYLLKNPRVDIKGIVTAGNGASHPEYGAHNVLNLLELIGDPRVPVSLGVRESLTPVGSYPGSWREQADTVAGIQLPRSGVHPVSEKGLDFILNTLSENEEKITLFSMAPLTNIALALQKKPEIKDKIRRIFVVGGALLSSGNLVGKPLGFKNRFAEYYIFLDAKAAQIVLESGVPITLIPIDITEQVPSDPFLQKLSRDRKTPAANFAYEILKPSVQSKKRPREVLWDSIAAVLITNPDVGNYRELKVLVNLRKGPEYGRLIMSTKGYSIQVVTQIDTDQVYDLLLAGLNRPSHLQLPSR
jgi:inosine-uridine nucleoside N-ribohydrolase